MNTHTFTLILDREPTEAEIDAMYEAGCDDGAVETGPLGSFIEFDREAATLAEAVISAVHDIEQAGLYARGIRSEDLVTLKDIATRVGKTYESVRLLALGRRGPGGFPAPLSAEGWSLYSWTQVARWFRDRLAAKVVEPMLYEREIAALDLVLRAREILGDGAERRELAELLK